jgi:hypothetical protein
MMDPTDPTTIDRDTALIGLTAIGVGLYDDGPDPEPELILAAERAVFAHQFDPIWRTLTNDDRRWLREKLDREDGAFDRMLADYESRSTQPSLSPGLLDITLPEARAELDDA